MHNPSLFFDYFWSLQTNNTKNIYPVSGAGIRTHARPGFPLKCLQFFPKIFYFETSQSRSLFHHKVNTSLRPLFLLFLFFLKSAILATKLMCKNIHLEYGEISLPLPIKENGFMNRKEKNRVCTNCPRHVSHIPGIHNLILF